VLKILSGWNCFGGEWGKCNEKKTAECEKFKKKKNPKKVFGSRNPFAQ
jgi:hypothetical protein